MGTTAKDVQIFFIPIGKAAIGARRNMKWECQHEKSKKEQQMTLANGER